ncbi:hypothetical protein ACRAWC_15605 [Leifsonia sp. L25]|uniref:hypothetical protein n=1 Tax=Leifsonia sp. L25 TaxID=3423957 RepID=UPI000EB07B62
MLTWLLLFARIAKTTDAALAVAADVDAVPADASALQDRWESIIVLRATQRGLAVALMCATQVQV